MFLFHGTPEAKPSRGGTQTVVTTLGTPTQLVLFSILSHIKLGKLRKGIPASPEEYNVKNSHVLK